MLHVRPDNRCCRYARWPVRPAPPLRDCWTGSGLACLTTRPSRRTVDFQTGESRAGRASEKSSSASGPLSCTLLAIRLLISTQEPFFDAERVLPGLMRRVMPPGPALLHQQRADACCDGMDARDKSGLKTGDIIRPCPLASHTRHASPTSHVSCMNSRHGIGVEMAHARTVSISSQSPKYLVPHNTLGRLGPVLQRDGADDGIHARIQDHDYPGCLEVLGLRPTPISRRCVSRSAEASASRVPAGERVALDTHHPGLPSHHSWQANLNSQSCQELF